MSRLSPDRFPARDEVARPDHLDSDLNEQLTVIDQVDRVTVRFHSNEAVWARITKAEARRLLEHDRCHITVYHYPLRSPVEAELVSRHDAIPDDPVVTFDQRLVSQTGCGMIC